MSFKKGEIPNPLGAGASVARKSRQLKELLIQDVDAALQVIRDCLSEPANKTWAAQQILDRVYGKAAQAVELSGTDGEPLKIGITFNLKDTKKQLPPSDTD